MKNILFILLFVVTASNAQTEIVPVEELRDYLPNNVSGKYFKDVNNVLNKFVGTWKYQDTPTNPTKVLYVTFYKNVNGRPDMFRKDDLYAAYRYYENGVEIYNTESEQYPLIYGGMFRDSQNTYTFNLIYDEPTEASKALRYTFRIKYLLELPNPKLQWDVNVSAEIAEGAALPRIPQHIVLTKQP